VGYFRRSRPAPGWVISAEQLRSDFQVLASEIESISQRLDVVESDKYAVPSMYRDLLTDIFIFTSVSTETTDELKKLIDYRAVSPPAAHAAMQSINMFLDHIEEFKVRVKDGLLELEVTSDQAREIVKDAWKRAKSKRPVGLETIETQRGGKEEWDWIDEQTWR